MKQSLLVADVTTQKEGRRSGGSAFKFGETLEGGEDGDANSSSSDEEIDMNEEHMQGSTAMSKMKKKQSSSDLAAKKKKAAKKRKSARVRARASTKGQKEIDARQYQIEGEKTYFFDYNTVETVLLGCAVLICLSGVMFENERYTERNDVDYEKEVITWCVFAIIFGSLIYYGMVFVAEVFGYTPKCLMKCFASKKTLAAMRNADKVERGEADMEFTGRMHANPSFSANKVAEIELKMTSMKTNMSSMRANQTAAEQRVAKAESKSQQQLEQQANLMKAYRNTTKENEQLKVRQRGGARSGSVSTKKSFDQAGVEAGQSARIRRRPSLSNTSNPLHQSFRKSAETTPVDEAVIPASASDLSFAHDIL